MNFDDGSSDVVKFALLSMGNVGERGRKIGEEKGFGDVDGCIFWPRKTPSIISGIRLEKARKNGAPGPGQKGTVRCGASIEGGTWSPGYELPGCVCLGWEDMHLPGRSIERKD
jgi:hypothetical protein